MAVAALTEEQASRLAPADLAAYIARKRWLMWARHPDRGGKQLPPVDDEWQIMLMLAGRGFGKSRALYEFGWWECWRLPGIIGHVVAPTLSDVRGTSFEGPVGLCTIVPKECLLGGTVEKAYNKTTHELRFSNGSLIRGFGAQEEAGRLRGPQCHWLVGDELREWDKPAGNLEVALNNALFGLRLIYSDGTPSRALLGTTPKPIPFLKRLTRREGLRLVRGTSRENLRNLSASFREHLLSLSGTLMGRQEIDAAFIDEESDLSILKRSWIRLFPAYDDDGSPRRLPAMQFVIESYDTASSEENYDAKRQTTDPSACVVLGVFNLKDAFSEAERLKMKVRGRYAAVLLDCWTERLGEPELLDRAREQHRTKWGPSPGKRGDVVLIEDKSSGPGLRRHLAAWGVPCWPYNPGRQNKTVRMHAIAPIVMQGGLFVPESMQPSRKGMVRDWAEPFMEQVCAFAGPGSVEHDDYVDALTQAVSYLRDRSLLEATPAERYLDREEKIEQDREEARRLHDEQQNRERVNPYGV